MRIFDKIRSNEFVLGWPAEYVAAARANVDEAEALLNKLGPVRATLFVDMVDYDGGDPQEYLVACLIPVLKELTQDRDRRRTIALMAATIYSKMDISFAEACQRADLLYGMVE